MKRFEFEELILEPDFGAHGMQDNKVSSHVTTGLGLATDPEEKGLVELAFAAREKDWVTVLVLDGMGSTCLQREKRSKKGNNLFQLDLRHLAPGKYKIRILSTEGLLSGEIIL